MRIEKITSRLKLVEEVAISLVLGLIFLLVPLQVFLRYVPQASRGMLEMTDRLVEFTGVALVWIVIIGMVHLLHEGGHLRVPYLEEKLGAKANQVLKLLLTLPVGGALVLLLISSIRTAQDFADMKTTMLGWSYLIYYGPLAVFSAIGVLITVVSLVTTILQVVTGAKGSTSPANQ